MAFRLKILVAQIEFAFSLWRLKNPWQPVWQDKKNEFEKKRKVIKSGDEAKMERAKRVNKLDG